MRRCLVSVGVLTVLSGSAVALGVPAAQASTQPAAVCDATTCTTTFLETGDVQTYTVPSFVTSLQASVAGGRGGDSLLEGDVIETGGLGGETAATIATTSHTLFVVVGGAGGDVDGHYLLSSGPGGYGGGGTGGVNGPVSAPGGGGGSFLFGGNGDPLLLAAGGGGGAAAAGAGFAANPRDGGAGGGAGAPAAAGTNGDDGATAGEPATTDGDGAGGNAATDAGSAPGNSGTTGMDLAATALPVGGAGGGGTNPGGGGGGGFHAGGGGGSDAATTTNGNGNGAGGGGGAGFAATASSVTDVTGSAGVQAGNGEVTLTYTKALQPPLTFTSTPPVSPVVGQTYAVAAAIGNSGTGNPATFSIDSSTASDCTASGATVTFIKVGQCIVDANQAGDATHYQPASAVPQTITVGKAGTKTVAAVHSTTITATVTPAPAGSLVPTGSVSFSVNGSAVGSANLDGTGVATLTRTVPTTATQQVSAVYSGNAGFTGSSSTISRKNPSITAKVSSTAPKTKSGWYRLPVTVTFHCATTSASLTVGCPASVTLTKSAANQSVSRTITAADGGTATASVTGINIDSISPTLTISGAKSGHTYPSGRTIKCVAHDGLSGLAAACQLIQQRTTKRGVSTVTYVATAVDKAGNVATRTGHYLIKH
jgi:Bacterial Ig-like domain (group 3)